MIDPQTGLEEEDELTKLAAESQMKQAALDEANSSYDTRGAIAGALASLGAGFQGKDSMAAVGQIQNQRRVARADEQSALDKWKAAKMAEIEAKRSGVKAKREDEKYAQDQELLGRERDPNSQESKMAHDLAVAMGYKGGPVTAEQFKSFSPVMQKKYEIEQRKLDRQAVRDATQTTKDIKYDEQMQALQTPFGLANTKDDAKNLKSGFEAKQNFDSKIQEMINLRKQYGTEYFNREAVARGKQLASDLLLAYKDMSKLGVLSDKDTQILNAIIPADPLAQDWTPGQDPILTNLEKFKGDSDRDFQTKIATRTRSGVQTAATPQTKEVLKTQTNAKTGEKRVVYKDGTIEVIPSMAQAGGR